MIALAIRPIPFSPSGRAAAEVHAEWRCKRRAMMKTSNDNSGGRHELTGKCNQDDDLGLNVAILSRKVRRYCTGRAAPSTEALLLTEGRFGRCHRDVHQASTCRHTSSRKGRLNTTTSGYGDLSSHAADTKGIAIHMVKHRTGSRRLSMGVWNSHYSRHCQLSGTPNRDCNSGLTEHHRLH